MADITSEPRTTHRPPRPARPAVARGLPLLPGQGWFLQELYPSLLNPNRWTLCKLFRLPHSLDADLVRAAAEGIWRQHDAIRTCFFIAGESWRQEITDVSTPLPFRYIDLSRVPVAERYSAIETITNEVQSTINIETGPLALFVYLRLGAGEQARLLMACHHLVCDGISLSILAADLEITLRRVLAGQPATLRRSTARYEDCVRAVAGYAASAELSQELPYWLAQPWDDVVAVPLDPANYHRGSAGSWTTETVTFDGPQADALVRHVPATMGVDLDTMVFAAVSECMARWAGGAVCARVVRYGRNITRANGQGVLVMPPRAWRTVGWLSTIGLQVMTPRSSADPATYVRQAAERIKAAPNYGTGITALRWLAPLGRHAAAVADMWRKSGFMFNNLGSIGATGATTGQAGPAGRLLMAADEPSGNYHDPLEPRLPVHIRVRVTHGRLSVMWDYDPFLCPPATLGRVAEEFRDVLLSYAACAAK